ncbi:hypothetical protein BKA70DRAFT_1333782 [Coprinopsis sp. MPI-PUGE-AT-0042]|nr:hypothetical protein BKA70DRAFT_1333782 [Coprinopsis sp. MPI-PUGE-AT-0042]
MGQTVSWLISEQGAPARLAGQLATNLSSLVGHPPAALSVQEVLLEHLPIEIIHLILDKAEYWPRLLSQRESEPPLRIFAAQSPTNNASHCYSQSCLTHESRMKPRRVVFHVLSHDQGWGGDPNLTGAFVKPFEDLFNLPSSSLRSIRWVMDLV